MSSHICSDRTPLRNIIGYIGEVVATDYLRKLGFDAHMIGNSGRGSRVGDILLWRTWFHNNGDCHGHCDTVGIEIKTTLSKRFQVQLTERQKKHWKLPSILIKVIKLSNKGIDYDVKEVPNEWSSSKFFDFWKGEPHYYDNNAPRKCHKPTNINSGLTPEYWREYQRRRIIDNLHHLRWRLKQLNYWESVYPLPESKQTLLDCVDGGIIERAELG